MRGIRGEEPDWFKLTERLKYNALLNRGEQNKISQGTTMVLLDQEPASESTVGTDLWLKMGKHPNYVFLHLTERSFLLGKENL